MNFPFDPNLWNKAEADLIVLSARKRKWVYSTLIITFLVCLIGWLWYDVKNEIAANSVKKSDNSSVNLNEQNSKKDKFKGTNIEYNRKETFAEKQSTLKDKNAGKKGVKLNKSSNKSGVITEPILNAIASNSVETSQNNGSKKVEIPAGASKEELPINNTNQTNKGSLEELPTNTTNHTNKDALEAISLISKTGTKLPFNVLNIVPEPNKHNFWPTPKKFATYIEFENYTSLVLNQKVSGLNKSELELKKKYETPQNLTGYGLNVILQRGGLGLVIGLGQLQTDLNTNYTTDTSYKLVSTTTKYKMVQDSVRYSGGYYSKILEYEEGIYEPLYNFNGAKSSISFRWVQMPVRLSYQYNRNRLRFSLRAGVDVMYLYKVQGAYINSSLDGLTKIGSGNQTINRWNLSGNVQFMTGFQLNKQWQLGAQAFYNQQLGSNFSKYNSRFQSSGIGWYLRRNI